VNVANTDQFLRFTLYRGHIERKLNGLFILRSCDCGHAELPSQCSLQSKYIWVKKLVKALGSILVLTALQIGSVSWADERHGEEGRLDHERVFKAVQAGRIKPLSVVLDYVARKFQTPVIGVEFEIKDGVWIYEIVTLGPDGRVSELYFDAATAQLIKIKKEGETEYSR